MVVVEERKIVINGVVFIFYDFYDYLEDSFIYF